MAEVNEDVRRKAERVIIGELLNFTNKTDEELAVLGLTRLEATTLAGWKYLVSRGGTDNDAQEAATQEPPFVLAEAQEAEEMIAGVDPANNTWRVNMAVAYITELTDVLPKNHSENVALLRKGIAAIRPGVELDIGFRLHGLNIIGADDFEDETKQARGDVISIVLGCSG